jgi:hypothetical protein
VQLNHFLERYFYLTPINYKVVFELLDCILIDKMSLKLKLEVLEDAQLANDVIAARNE